GVERRVPKKFESGSVVFVGAGLGGHIDLRRPAAEFGRVYACLDFEFLDRVDGWPDDIRVEVRVSVFHAIERVAIEFQALPGNGEGSLAADAALAAGSAGSALSGHVRAQRNELQIVAAVERRSEERRVGKEGRCGWWAED